MSLRFDGVDDRATVGVNLGGMKVCTVACWCTWDQSYANDDDFIMEYSIDTNSNNGFYIDPNSSASLFNVQFTDLATGSGSQSYRYNRSLFPINTWHHLVLSLSYPSQSLALYLDGVYRSPAVFNPPVNAGSTFTSSMFYLYHRSNGPSLFGAGRMAELSIWGSFANVLTLTEQHVTHLYGGGSPFDISSPMELLGYYPMDNVFDGYRNRVTKKHSPVGFSGGQPTNAPQDMPVNLSTAYKGVPMLVGGQATITPAVIPNSIGVLT